MIEWDEFSSDEWVVFSGEEWTGMDEMATFPLNVNAITRMPQLFIDILVAKSKKSSTNAWSEYNCKMVNYEALSYYAQQGLLKLSDIPIAGPNISDYPDLVLKIDGGCLGPQGKWWLKQENPN